MPSKGLRLVGHELNVDASESVRSPYFANTFAPVLLSSHVGLCLLRSFALLALIARAGLSVRKIGSDRCCYIARRQASSLRTYLNVDTNQVGLYILGRWDSPPTPRLSISYMLERPIACTAKQQIHTWPIRPKTHPVFSCIFYWTFATLCKLNTALFYPSPFGVNIRLRQANIARLKPTPAALHPAALHPAALHPVCQYTHIDWVQV
ncbi:hypothetical protein RhiJN_23031 [Ceratobasidium sp. AG-Ba]|nr:hypothetical protein RhiJN_23031 [Ceratobasidium sp. AG-Ba]